MSPGPFLLVVALAAGAGNDAPTATRLIGELAACRAIVADAERLRCLDRAAAAVVDAERSKEIVLLDKTEVRRTKRSLFGFSLPALQLFGDGKDDEPMREVSGTMVNSIALTGGLLRFELDGAGGVWDTTESATVVPRKGDVVTIKAGPLGSYVATAPKRRALRVRRVR